ncbi:UNVERIFIED_CONTAM: hypothetical protein PYX00_005402 [Menopon gallinae]
MENDRREQYRITLTNICENETFRYSLPIIKGFISAPLRKCPVAGAVFLKKLDPVEEVTVWPVVNGHFKCLADLSLGRNRFFLDYHTSRLCLNLEFQSKCTKYHVLPVYIICSGSDGRFQAPDDEDSSPESACRRISLGARLIQSLTAEKLREMGMTRRTFQLARDMDEGTDCVIFRSKLKAEEVYEMRPEEIWEHFGRELMSSPYGSDRRKFLAFLSCTRYQQGDKVPETHEEVIARVRGHVALGGGGLAVFGTGCLYTWPETIHQILPKFTDHTKVDKLRFMDDSCYRGTYGGCFSTTLGAVCHELGHAFDLGHCAKGIMGRGFDNVNLVFTTVDQPKDVNKNEVTRSEGKHATVSFTRDLSVTYTVSKKPLAHFQRVRRGSPQRRIAVEPNSVKTYNPKSWSDTDKKMFLGDDQTFWEKSCAFLLRYHK